MEHENRQRVLSSPGFRVARWIIPWVALGALLLAVGNLAGQFRDATASRNATGTVDATASAAATATTVPASTGGVVEQPQVPAGGVTTAVALVEGILLRKEPSANGEVLDRLGNGTEMTVLEQTQSWLKIRDPKGRVGWIRNNENLISLKTK